MTVKKKTLEILEKNKGSFISGEEISEKLNVTRNSVWKAINSLKTEGYVISAVTNKGYCLSEKSNVFTSSLVCSQLNDALREKLNVTVVPVVGSTNTELKAVGEKGGSEGTVLIALEQTEGRGRLGRSFYSPKDTGLYMSILLRPDFSPEESLFITACAAVAASEAIDKTGVKTEIKWVNDIYLNGKKVCGILTEASMDFESRRLNYAVLGIGINLITDGFPDELKNIAGSVSNKKDDLRAFIAAEFLNIFFSYYENLCSKSFLSEYRNRSMLIGKEITFSRGNELFDGEVTGIDDEMRLLVRLDNGETEAFSSGEVQLVKGGIIK
ncbi:MAG: biotin--[Ruminiclostridium sp.]|nr:biotin--[acetyl-CoA-carboxylase] ligase [Ruminiclostridium sp.]